MQEHIKMSRKMLIFFGICKHISVISATNFSAILRSRCHIGIFHAIMPRMATKSAIYLKFCCANEWYRITPCSQYFPAVPAGKISRHCVTRYIDNILQYRSIYAYIFRSYTFSYIGRYKTITYIGQYKPTSLKSFQYYIYRSIYADKRHISIHICNISWFKLGAYIDAIYVRSYNDRYIKTYILPKYITFTRLMPSITHWVLNLLK